MKKNSLTRRLKYYFFSDTATVARDIATKISDVARVIVFVTVPRAAIIKINIAYTIKNLLVENSPITWATIVTKPYGIT